MIIAVWTIVAAVTIMRGIAAFTVPLTGDEAYYWEWSRHLAFGYTDHPPMVAWTIALFSFLGTSPGAVRFGFVVCGPDRRRRSASRCGRSPRVLLDAGDVARVREREPGRTLSRLLVFGSVARGARLRYT